MADQQTLSQELEELIDTHDFEDDEQDAEADPPDAEANSLSGKDTPTLMRFIAAARKHPLFQDYCATVTHR